jgi:hypothetical protein
MSIGQYTPKPKLYPYHKAKPCLQAFKVQTLRSAWNYKAKEEINNQEQSITSRVDSGEDPLIEGAGSEVPDLVRVREQTLAYDLGSTWW